MKLAIMRRIAHHTSGDARPLIPVQENASSGAAMSVAPRFKSSSEANTHTTLTASCSHGLPKPDGRFCIRFFSARSKHRNRFRSRRDAVAQRADCTDWAFLKVDPRSETFAILDRVASDR